MIFLDSGAFIARSISVDQHHADAVRLWRHAAREERVFTGNFVVQESIDYFARKVSFSFAIEQARSLRSVRDLTLLRPQEEDEADALDLFEKYADNRIGFTDCLSAALMRRHKIKRIFTFDRHFERMGFELFRL